MNWANWRATWMLPDAEAIAGQVFTALADPTRRSILAALASGGPATATDLAVVLPITRQAIAKHLGLLAEAGLVTAERGNGAGCVTGCGRLPCRWRSSSWPRWRATGTAGSTRSRTISAGRPDGPLWPGTEDSIDHTNRKAEDTMKTPPIVTAQEWETAREQLLVKEKELTRARDALAAERRRMPWVEVEKEYEFEGPSGRASLLDLFAGRRQLIIYRAFFEPGVTGWPEHACHGCSMMADQVAHVAHLNARDITFAYASRAPQPDIARLKARMGWAMPWYTLTGSWDVDFGVDEYHGTNAFFRDGDRVFRTYFLNNRGDEALGSTWSYLDMSALGRQETWEDSPDGYPQTEPYNWWNWHDEYEHPELAQGPMKWDTPVGLGAYRGVTRPGSWAPARLGPGLGFAPGACSRHAGKRTRGPESAGHRR